jgi:anti-anti-sigma factor
MEHSGSAALPQLRITSEWRDACRVVTAAGQVDLSNTHQLHYALTSALHPDRPLIADLTAVTFLDSRGLRTLMLMQRNAELQGARLVIVPSEEIAALIRLGAAGALTVSPSLATALRTAHAATPGPVTLTETTSRSLFANGAGQAAAARTAELG